MEALALVSERSNLDINVDETSKPKGRESMQNELGCFYPFPNLISGKGFALVNVLSCLPPPLAIE